MNLLKNLKLVLLASSVILSPKGGYAADHERDDVTAKLGRSGPSQSFNSMLPAVGENKLPSLSSSSSRQSSVERHQESIDLFGRDNVLNKSIKQRIEALRNQNSPEKFFALTNAIRVNLIEKFVFQSKYTTVIPRAGLAKFEDMSPSPLQKIVDFALSLPIDEIESRSTAIEKMAYSLYTFQVPGYALLPSFVQTPSHALRSFMAQEGSLSIIDNVLKLNSHQIDNRTHMIKNESDYLLPVTEAGRATAIGSLMQLHTEEIKDRADVMKKFKDKVVYLADRRLMWKDYSNIFVAASQLDTAELKSRINSVLESPLLEWITRFPQSITSIFTLSFDQLNKRIATIRQYEDLLSKYLSSSSGTEKVVNLLESTVYEIYKMASHQLCTTYFEQDFLPRLGEEFRKLNRSQLGDEDIYKILLPNHFLNSRRVDFSPENVRERLSKFGSVYLGLYNPPSFPEPVFAVEPSNTHVVAEPVCSSSSSSSKIDPMHTLLPSFASVLTPSLSATRPAETRNSIPQPASNMHTLLPSFAESSSSLSSAPMTYEEYFKKFLPEMGESCRAYNNFQKTDEEILSILFPGLSKGAYPDRATAIKKFAELAEGGRPYAKLFNPPSF